MKKQKRIKRKKLKGVSDSCFPKPKDKNQKKIKIFIIPGRPSFKVCMPRSHVESAPIIAIGFVKSHEICILSVIFGK